MTFSMELDGHSLFDIFHILKEYSTINKNSVDEWSNVLKSLWVVIFWIGIFLVSCNY